MVANLIFEGYGLSVLANNDKPLPASHISPNKLLCSIGEGDRTRVVSLCRVLASLSILVTCWLLFHVFNKRC